ncbi:MAG: hypothetical protein LBP85_05765 [Prevotellaceae bacterium]|jgi:hypothetical protein|nr:hypothetical protein [Prevotellaceae bacterium]
MKNKLIKTIKLFAIIIIGCFCMAGSCGGGGSGSGGSLPACAISTNQSIFVTTVKLGYNFTNAPAAFDIAYFRTYHPYFTGTNGEINYLSDIVNDFAGNAFYGGSSLKIDISSTACSGTVPFTATNSSHLFANWLYFFPLLDVAPNSTISMTCQIQSVKEIHNIYILWNCSPVVTAGGQISRIEATGIFKYPGSGSGAYIIIPIGGNHPIHGGYSIIENASIDYDYDGINWDEVSFTTDDNVKTNTLSRSVYINGSYNNNVQWNEPVYLALY